ncbi:glycosyltransferase family 39 protein [Novipirellula rosea]|uniref:ArnT-like N-terminal domain-containing protein n=1 Tax=Novipirellula rosea TaxID=1031540 RepID=A0ABP8N529_9BACT
MVKRIKRNLRAWWNDTQFPIATCDHVTSVRQWTPRQEKVAALILTLACCVVLLPNLSYPLIDPDETRYAQIAIEMNDSRDWVTPTLEGQAYLDKPPLMYWLTAASLHWLGNNETAARLPSVLASIATVLVAYLLGRRILGSRAAWLGGIVLLLSGGFVIAGRFLILDSLLAFFVTVCFLTGYIAVRETEHRWTWWMISAVACALGVLTKGPVAFVLCVPPLITSGWLRRDHTRTRLVHWVVFVLPIVIVCVPWYVAVWKFNPEFGDYFFWEHNFKRFTQGSNHEEPFWFYLPVIFIGMFPASLLLPSLAVYLVSRKESNRVLRSKDLGFLFCSAVWILLFFSIASCKLPTYILPAIPLMALMLGGMLDQTVLRPERTSGITTYLNPFPQRANLILLVTGGVIVMAEIKLGGHVDLTMIVFALLCTMVLLGTCLAWNREIAFSRRAWAGTAIVGILLLGYTTARFIPKAATQRSLYSKTASILEQHPDAMAVFYGEHAHAASLQLPLERVVYFPLEWKSEFAAFMAKSHEVIVVADEEHLDETRDAIARTHKLIATGIHKRVYMGREIDTPDAKVGMRNDGAMH